MTVRCTLMRCSTFSCGSTARSIREQGDLSSASQKGFSRPRLISHRGGHWKVSTRCPVRFHHTHAAPFLLRLPQDQKKKERPLLRSFSSYHSNTIRAPPQSSNSSRLSSTPRRKQTHQKKDTTDCAKTFSRKCYRKNRERQEQTIKHKRGNSSNHKHASSSQVPVQLHYKPWKHSDDVAAPRLPGNYFRV
jgi:hypothetical protein